MCRTSSRTLAPCPFVLLLGRSRGSRRGRVVWPMFESYYLAVAHSKYENSPTYVGAPCRLASVVAFGPAHAKFKLRLFSAVLFLRVSFCLRLDKCGRRNVAGES